MSARISRRALIANGLRTLAIAGMAPPLSLLQTPSASRASTSRYGAPPKLSAPQTEYFVSALGDDEADGLTPRTAWRSLQRVSDSLPNYSSVSFKRGEVFYGELKLPLGSEVQAFGTGTRPVLSMYKILNEPDGWSEYEDGIWMIDLGSPATHGGYTSSSDANIGFLLVDGAVQPALKFSLEELASLWDFYADIPNHILYVKSPINPTQVATDLRAAPNGGAYGPSGAIIYCQQGGNQIHDIHVTGSGGCGIRGSAADVHIHDCLIDYIGGARLPRHDGKNLRWGNAIENWFNVSRWTIEDNEIGQVYDAGWTCQGSDPNDEPIFWEDMVVRNNHIHDCGQTMELWSESSNPASPGFVRITFEKNLCERAGGGPFSPVRPDQDVRVQLLTYRLQTPVDVRIVDNIFDGSGAAYSYHSVEPPSGYVTSNNVIRLTAGTRMEFQRDQTVEQAALWQAQTGSEAGSIISTIPD